MKKQRQAIKNRKGRINKQVRKNLDGYGYS